MSARFSLARSIRRRVAAGFGLIELVIVVAILGILAALGVPSFRQSIHSNRVTTEANDLVSAINTARGEATTRSRRVTACPSTNGTSCNTTNWGAPAQWIVFTDYGVIGTVEPADTILRVWKPVDGGDLVTSSNAVNWISFDRTGTATTDNAVVNNTNTGLPALTLTLRPQGCTSGAKNLRTVALQLVGRVSTTTGACP
jgi:type IV fimbrial biogenesis protein FimT